MADFYPLIANTSAGQIQEIPSTANLNLSGCNVINTGTYYGSGAGLTNLPGGNVTGTVANATYATSAGSATTATTAGTVTTAAQPNITSVGTLTSLAVTGNTTSGNFVGTLNGSGANVTSISATNISSGTLAQERLANSAVTLGSTALTLGSTVTTVAGLTSVTSTTFVGALTGAATTAGTVTTAAQPNITSVGTLSSLTVTANVAGGNVTTAGVFAGSGAQLTSIPAANITGTLSVNTTGSAATLTTSRNINGVAFNGSADITVTAAASTLSGTTLASGVVTSSLTTVGALNSGSITSGFGAIDIGTDTVTCGGIVNSNANGIGNIGSSTTYFNTVFAKATSAQYADLAEMYVADANYQPGTVLEFGGNQEVTATAQSHSTRVAGIVSTNPSYLMNATQAGEYVVAVALTGRVPCRVQGPVRKGDVLVSSDTPGVAQRIGVNWQPGCTVGKAMEVIETSDIQVIEVAVGRL